MKYLSGIAERICAKLAWKACLVPGSDQFEGQGQGYQGQKQYFSALSAACVRFVFSKTSLASSFSTDVFYACERVAVA